MSDSLVSDGIDTSFVLRYFWLWHDARLRRGQIPERQHKVARVIWRPVGCSKFVPPFAARWNLVR